jgi:hypothetical protein
MCRIFELKGSCRGKNPADSKANRCEEHAWLQRFKLVASCYIHRTPIYLNYPEINATLVLGPHFETMLTCVSTFCTICYPFSF